MNTVTLNEQQRLYVIPAGGGFTCLGFDNCHRNARQLAEKLNLQHLLPGDAFIGKMEMYQAYQEMLTIASRRGAQLGTWFDPGTPKQVQDILEQARKYGMRLRIFYGDSETGRDWMEEHDVVGYIGRSGGTLKSPLIIPGRNDCGGPAILTACLVRIIETSSKSELYRHPKYHLAKLEYAASDVAGYPHQVTADGSVHARFKKHEQALNWIAFMQGTRMRT